MSDDRLTLGKELHPGEFIVSEDGRFRLYLKENGYLVAFAYSPEGGVQRYWENGTSAGPNAVARFEYYEYPQRSQYWPALALHNENGARVWQSGANAMYFPRLWEALFCVIGRDGNIVVYADSRNHQNVVRSVWASDSYRRWNRELAVQPNTTIVHMPSPGSLVLDPNGGNYDIANTGSRQIGVAQGTEYRSIPAGESIPVAIPSTVSISTTQYVFDDLRAPNGTMPERIGNNDALAPAPASGERGRIEVSNGGRLRLTGFLRHPDDGRRIVVSGDPLPINPDMEFDGEKQVPRKER